MVLVDQEGEPTVKGKEKFIAGLKEQKEEGLRYHSLKNNIADLWQDEENIYVLESFTYSISLNRLSLDLSGTGNSITIWCEVDQKLKIRYAIIQIENTFPKIN